MIDEGTLKAIAVIGMILVMCIAVILIVVHRIRTGMGFGYRFIQVICVAEVVPSVILLTVLGVIKGEAGAALLGAIVGYTFGLKAKEESS